MIENLSKDELIKLVKELMEENQKLKERVYGYKVEEKDSKPTQSDIDKFFG